MTLSRDRRSSAIPRWTLAVLAGSIVANTAIDLVLATLEYRSWEADYRTRGLDVSQSLGPLRDHLWFTAQQIWFPALFIVVGYVLARRGRRWLFAGPAAAFFVVPLLVGLIRGGPGAAIPGLDGGFGRLAWEHGMWVSWLMSGLRLFLFLLPGFVVVRRVQQERNPFRVPALVLVAIPALVTGYLGVLVVSPTGRIQNSAVDLFIAAFFFGAAMGFDRPWWPWLLVAIPGLMEGLPALFLAGEGNEVVVISLIALLGASSVPFSRILYRGWQENLSPGSPHEADSLAG